MSDEIEVRSAVGPGAHARVPIVVCADDYGLTPGVGRGIRELLLAGRISATSVMTVTPDWPQEAAALGALAIEADIGLHLTLTDHRPLGPMPKLAPSGKLPPLGEVYRAAVLRRLPLDEIAAELDRQLQAFIDHRGRSPSHIDGHHHVHQLPGVRDLVIEAAARFAPTRVWVRCCDEPLARLTRRGIAIAKASVIGAFGPGVRRRAEARRVVVNVGFSGVYDFLTERRGTDELFAGFVDGAGPGHLVMCHPGYVDEALLGLDPMTAARRREFDYLSGPGWAALCEDGSIAVTTLDRCFAESAGAR